MNTIKREQYIVDFFLSRNEGSSSEIHAFITDHHEAISLVTVKRLLSSLVKKGTLAKNGTGPSTSYTLTVRGLVFAPLDAKAYCTTEPDRRVGFSKYNFSLFRGVTFDLFTPRELARLESATATYRERSAAVSATLHQKELERFIIELSWKSSKIEGNTYTLLDTERLLADGIEAPEHTKHEAVMIINHKRAFSYIYEHQEVFKTVTSRAMDDVHRLLVADLGISYDFRAGLVGVTGSRYMPLDNQHQVKEAVLELVNAMARMKNGYAGALLALLGISYIQPFDDGNKRTARLMANAVLLAHGLAPLSYRSINEETYRESTLAFYERNTILPIKDIFIEQYEFAARHYAGI